MPIRAVIFDLGGVLLRQMEERPRTELAARYGLSRTQLEALVFESEQARRAAVGELDVTAVWEPACAALGLTAATLPEFQQQFWAGDRIDMELVAFIRTLRGPYHTALLSNAWSNLRAILTGEWRIADAFDELIISAEVRLAKPDPRIYRLALERLAVTPAETIFVDDMAENVAAARSVGLHALQFQGPAQTRAAVQQLLQAT